MHHGIGHMATGGWWSEVPPGQDPIPPPLTGSTHPPPLPTTHPLDRDYDSPPGQEPPPRQGPPPPSTGQDPALPTPRQDPPPPPPWQGPPPPPPEHTYRNHGQRAGGTHPTGMHSYSKKNSINLPTSVN